MVIVYRGSYRASYRDIVATRAGHRHLPVFAHEDVSSVAAEVRSEHERHAGLRVWIWRLDLRGSRLFSQVMHQVMHQVMLAPSDGISQDSGYVGEQRGQRRAGGGVTTSMECKVKKIKKKRKKVKKKMGKSPLK